MVHGCRQGFPDLHRPYDAGILRLLDSVAFASTLWIRASNWVFKTLGCQILQMRTRTRNLLLVLLVALGFISEASATTTMASPTHNWTIRVGHRTFGVTGYSPPVFGDTWTSIHYGLREYRLRAPFHKVVALSLTLPVLIGSGCLFMVRRRNKIAERRKLRAIAELIKRRESELEH